MFENAMSLAGPRAVFHKFFPLFPATTSGTTALYQKVARVVQVMVAYPHPALVYFVTVPAVNVVVVAGLLLLLLRRHLLA